MKIIIHKINDSTYKINGKFVKYNKNSGTWTCNEFLSVKEIYALYKFFEFGELDKNKLEQRIQELQIEKSFLINKIISYLKKDKMKLARIQEVRLAKIIEKLSNLKYNAVIYGQSNFQNN